MIDTASNYTKELQVEKPFSDVEEAIAFIPALSKKYKLVKSDPLLHVYALSGSEASKGSAYINVHCSRINEFSTSVRLEVRREDGTLRKNIDESLANQHMDTVFNLLSDGLVLEPSEKSKLLSGQANRKTVGAYYTSQTKSKTGHKDGREKQPSFFPGWALLCLVLTSAVLLFILIQYFKR